MPEHNVHPLTAISDNPVFSAEGIAPLVYGITGAFTRQEFDVGSYQAKADCSGGQIIVNLSSTRYSLTSGEPKASSGWPSSAPAPESR